MDYTGTDDLYNLECMVNYNNSIVKKIEPYIKQYGDFPKILDFGAGIGTISMVIKDVLGIKPDTLEIDSNQANVISTRGFAVYSKLEEIQDKYNVILLSNVLEHIENDREILVSLKNLLTEDGIIYIFVPAHNFLWTEMDDQVLHYRRYNKRMLSNLAHDLSGQILELKYTDSLGALLIFLLKTFGIRRAAESQASLKFYDKYLFMLSKTLDSLGSNGFFGRNVYVVMKF